MQLAASCLGGDFAVLNTGIALFVVVLGYVAAAAVDLTRQCAVGVSLQFLVAVSAVHSHSVLLASLVAAGEQLPWTTGALTAAGLVPAFVVFSVAVMVFACQSFDVELPRHKTWRLHYDAVAALAVGELAECADQLSLDGWVEFAAACFAAVLFVDV